MGLRRIEKERRRENGRRRVEKGEWKKESGKRRVEKEEWKKMNERKDEGNERRKVEISMRKESLRNQLLMHRINR